jgi:Haem-binding domain
VKISPGKIALGAVGLILIIQLFRPSRTNPPMEAAQDLSAAMHVDAGVQAILDRSCNDCHSNRTVWPWYSEIAPISWLVASDVNGARRHVNFSAWGAYPAYQRQSHLDDICKMVTERDMPPLTYTLMHAAARLSEPDRQAICAWTKAAGQSAAVDGIPHAPRLQ